MNDIFTETGKKNNSKIHMKLQKTLNNQNNPKEEQSWKLQYRDYVSRIVFLQVAILLPERNRL